MKTKNGKGWSYALFPVQLEILCVCGVCVGEIQGTVHRRLLEDRLGELKAGAVLLLKQARLPHGCHVTAVTSS